ncbi:hypothetical protein [Winogradskyella vidalii]|uniref:hypothetical protein n=1 Tax=Winogradskyella vidalii TaxID=2615024 RepID=UPI001C53E15E|nr:hypothetical protein [Winogradskyella vidalii]
MKKIIPIICLVLSLVACERESDFTYAAPSLITSYEGNTTVIQEPGNEVYLDFKLQAASGLSSFVVHKDGALYYEQAFIEGEISYDYEFNYIVPEDSELGDESTFTFLLLDNEGREVSYSYTIQVNVTFSETEEDINGTSVIKLKGKSNNDYLMEANLVYLIDSTFSIENNSRLTIEPGTNVYFKTYDNDIVSRLMIARGSRIQAEGTAESPIIFTSDKLLYNETPTTEDWGGIYLFGQAPTNAGATILDAGFLYGGNIPNDSSGRLSYVRIEYTGKDGSNALNMFGVGSNTQIDHIHVYRNENIAFRLKGGRVNLKYIAGIGHGGYGVWAEHGWQGNGQFWIFQTDIAATLVPVNYWNQARSIEMRNDEGNFLKEPRTRFQISNVTLIGNGYTDDVDSGTRRGVRIRRGAHGVLQNLAVTEFPNDGVRVEDLDIDELGDTMILDHTRAFNNNINYEQEAESFFLDNPDFDVTTGNSGVTLNNFVGSVESSFNPIELGNWFSEASFIGAVENTSNDWTTEGNWFKNLDGTIR